MTQTVLITGGAGFVGSHLAERLLAQGESVVIVDDLSAGSLANLQHLLGERCAFVRGRVGRVLEIEPTLLDGVKHIYHLAASVGVQRAVEEPQQTITNNVDETAAVLRAATPRGIPVLITSSSEVYGKNPAIPLRESHDLMLGSTDSPRWSYALSKAIDEQLAFDAHRRQGLGVVIVRLFNTIGPRQSGRYGMVVPRFIQWALSGEDLVIHGDGSQTRCFCDVRDVVAALATLLPDPAHHGRVYNVGSDEELTIAELADRVLRLTGGVSGKRFISYDDAYRGILEDPPRRVPDLSRIRGAIGFRPAYTLDQTLAELISLARPASPRQRVLEET